ncbi:hypothetical protein BC826DRAFT_1030808, partial [Russula brevipes]
RRFSKWLFNGQHCLNLHRFTIGRATSSRRAQALVPQLSTLPAADSSLVCELICRGGDRHTI